MSEPMRLCKDCKHARKPFLGLPTPFKPYTYAICTATDYNTMKAPTLDPVDGRAERVRPEYRYCSTERHDWGKQSTTCGPEGKLWEPRT